METASLLPFQKQNEPADNRFSINKCVSLHAFSAKNNILVVKG